MNLHDIESALREGPPDEPKYEPAIAGRLAEHGRRDSSPDHNDESIALVQPAARGARRSLVFVAAAVVPLMVIAGLVALSHARRSPAPVTSPTVTDSSVDSTAPTSTAMPDRALLYDRWVGEPRRIAGVGTSTSAVIVEIDPGNVFQLHTGDADNPTVFGSTVGISGDQLVLRLISTDRGCNSGAVGRYRWALSADGATLSLTVVDDRCATRMVIEGTYTRSACPQVGQDCFGPVSRGEYASVAFDVFGTRAYGQVRYTLPDGWSVSEDSSVRLQLTPTAGRASGVVHIDVWADPVLAACAQTAPRSATTLAGRPAEVFTAKGESTCADGVLVAGSASPVDWSAAVEPGQQMRVFLVRLNDGHSVAVTVVGEAPTFEDAMADAMPIVESLVISSGAP